MYYNLLNRGFVKPEDTEPDIAGFEFYYDAFQELSTSRSIGLGVGPIPFTAIVEYSRIYELEEFEEFAYIIRKMDNAFLELNAQESNSKENKSANNNANKKNNHKG